MMEVGRLCVKLAGRDAGRKCVIVDTLEDNYVMVDGQTRRRKCNVNHLEPLNQTVKIKKGASSAEVKKALEALKIEVRTTKPRKATERPKKQKAKKASKPKETAKPVKTEKKETTKTETKKEEKVEAEPEKKPVKKTAPKKKTTKKADKN